MLTMSSSSGIGAVIGVLIDPIRHRTHAIDRVQRSYSITPGQTQLTLILCLEYFCSKGGAQESATGPIELSWSPTYIQSFRPRQADYRRLRSSISAFSRTLVSIWLQIASLDWQPGALRVQGVCLLAPPIETMPKLLAMLTTAPRFPGRPSWVGSGSCSIICAI